MTKSEFISQLRDKLSGLDENELNERLDFYCEMIDDKTEDGLTQEQAVLEIGSVDAVCEQILSEIPLGVIAKKKLVAKKRLGAFEIILLALGSPIWLSLLIAAFSVVVSVYLSVWSVIVSFWAIFVSLVACVPAAIVAGIIFIKTAGVCPGLFTFAAALVSAGLAIFCFFGCVGATKYTATLTKRIVLAIKKRLIKKEEA